MGCSNSSSAAATAEEYAGPVRLVDLQALKKLEAFPRCSDADSICVQLEDIDRENSFVVFISHIWLREWPGALDWDGKPHPDDVDSTKFHMCVTGIEEIHEQYAPKMKNVYLWIDYCSLNQDLSDPLVEYRGLGKIMSAADCMFTPIVADVDVPPLLNEWFSESDSKIIGWTMGEYAYLDRSMARLEMLYAETVPVHNDAHRREKFRDILKHLISHRNRPHFLLTQRNYFAGKPATLLPPIPREFLSKPLHPLRGMIGKESEKDHIKVLMTNLSKIESENPTVVSDSVSYEGETSSAGQPHGKGVARYGSGSFYEGEWHNGKQHGVGIFRAPSGFIYEGEYRDGAQHGRGLYRSGSGDIYEGEYVDGHRTGFGKHVFANGAVYEGEHFMDKRHGRGTFHFANGDVYVGMFQNNLPHGHGTFTFANGDIYEGYCENGMQHGKGVFRFANGAIYEGDYENGLLTGKGRMQFANGHLYEGDCKEDRPWGWGLFKYADGSSYKGMLMDGKMHGKGFFQMANGDTFTGDFLHGKVSGVGTYVWSHGNMYEGDFEEDVMTNGSLLLAESGKKYICEMRATSEKDGEGFIVYGVTLWNDDDTIYKQGKFSRGTFVE